MRNLFNFLFTTHIGRKIIMALTGLFLCLFLVVHLIGNLQLLYNDGGYSFNKYALFMTSNPLIKTVSYGLYAMILLHAIKGLFLAYKNTQARKKGYAVQAGSKNSSWSSRNMAILGSVIFIFIGIHMGDFWREYKFGDDMKWKKYIVDYNTGIPNSQEIEPSVNQIMSIRDTENGKVLILKDLYSEVWEAFEQWWIVLIYVISMIVLCFHLLHGFQSAFQSLGLQHKSYTPFVKSFGAAFSIIICAAFAVIPLFVILNG